MRVFISFANSILMWLYQTGYPKNHKSLNEKEPKFDKQHFGSCFVPFYEIIILYMPYHGYKPLFEADSRALSHLPERIKL
jgi:hypothetical protein